MTRKFHKLPFNYQLAPMLPEQAYFNVIILRFYEIVIKIYIFGNGFRWA